jgi:hypothetical protein
MIVMLPNTALDPTNATWVYDEATLQVELQTLGTSALFPKLNVNTAGAVPLHSRFMMYLTAKYAALLLDNKGYTPKQAFQLLLQAFQDDQVIQDMKPILNWLRVTKPLIHCLIRALWRFGVVAVTYF